MKKSVYRNAQEQAMEDKRIAELPCKPVFDIMTPIIEHYKKRLEEPTPKKKKK